MNKSVQGAALVIILFIAAILASTSILLIVKTKSHIERVSIIKDYLQAERDIVTDINHFIFSTKTSPYSIFGDSQVFSYDKGNLPQDINLSGQSFTFRQSTFSVQDMGGLVPLIPIEHQKITKYLSFLGWPKDQVAIFLDVLQDWIDQDQFMRLSGAENHAYDLFGYPLNQNLQGIIDIGLFAKVNPDLLQNLVKEESLLLYGVGKQIHDYAPTDLVPFYYSSLDTKKLLLERERSLKDASVSYTDQYTTGNWIIKVNASYMNAQSSKIIHLSKRFGDVRPFVITKWQDVVNN